MGAGQSCRVPVREIGDPLPLDEDPAEGWAPTTGGPVLYRLTRLLSYARIPIRYWGVGKRACSASFLEEFFSETQWHKKPGLLAPDPFKLVPRLMPNGFPVCRFALI